MSKNKQGYASILTELWEHNEFTRRFLQDTVYLMETESHISMDEIQRTMLAHHVAYIPLMVFEIRDGLAIHSSD